MPTRRLMHLHGATSNGERLERRKFQGVSSVHFLKLIEDQGEVGFWTKDFATGATTCSAGIYRMLSAEAGMPIDLLHMIHPEDREQHDLVEAGLMHGHPMDIDFRIIRADGTIRWINHRAEVIFDEHGASMRAIGVLRDVTERRELKRIVDRSWARHQKLLSLIGGVEWGLDLSGRLLFRQAWSKFSGQSVADASGLGWLDRLPPEGRLAAQRHWEEVLDQQATFDLETCLLCADGTVADIQLIAAPIAELDGTVTEWIGMVRPLSAPVTISADRTTPPLNLTRRQIRAARLLLGWTHEDLATEARISVSSIRRVEEGERAMRSTTYHAISTALLANGIEFGPNDTTSTTITVHHNEA